MEIDWHVVWVMAIGGLIGIATQILVYLAGFYGGV